MVILWPAVALRAVPACYVGAPTDPHQAFAGCAITR